MIYKIWRLLIYSTVGLWGLYSFWQLAEFAQLGARSPRWDEAAHATDAIYFAKAMANLSIPDFLAQLNLSAYWPPAFPLAIAPFIMAFGYSYETLRLICFTFAVLTLVVTAWASVRGSKTFFAPLVAVGALIVSPFFTELSSTVFLEVPGLLGMTLTTGFYLRYLETKKTEYIKWTFIGVSLCFFTKYNVAILMVIPILCHILINDGKFRLATLNIIGKWRRRISLKSLPVVLLAIYFATCFVVLQWGGIDTTIMGQKVIFKRFLGNPIYIPTLLTVIYLVAKQRSHLQILWQDLTQGPAPLKYLIYAFIIPASLWIIYPPFFKTFLIFIFNESTRAEPLLSWQTWSYYPKVLLFDYSPESIPYLGLALVLGCGLLLKNIKNRPDHQFLLIAILFNLFLITIHPNHGTRYLFFAYGLMAIGAGRGLEGLIDNTDEARWKEWLGATLGLGTAVFFTINLPTTKHYEKVITATTSDHTASIMAESLCPQLSQGGPNSVVGLHNLLSPSLIAWRCLMVDPDFDRSNLPSGFQRLGFHGYKEGKDILAAKRIRQIFRVHGDGKGQCPFYGLMDPKLAGEISRILPESKDYKAVGTIYQEDNGCRIDHYQLM